MGYTELKRLLLHVLCLLLGLLVMLLLLLLGLHLLLLVLSQLLVVLLSSGGVHKNVVVGCREWAVLLQGSLEVGREFGGFAVGMIERFTAKRPRPVQKTGQVAEVSALQQPL